MGIMSKIRSNKGIVTAGALVGVLAIAGTATAQGFGRGGGFPMMKMLRHLDLTEEQEIQAVKIRRAMREQRKAARMQMKTAMEQAQLELAKDNPDPQVLHAAVDKAAEQMKASMHTAVDQFLALHKTFTPEQREELSRMMERMKERRERRRERRHRHRGE